MWSALVVGLIVAIASYAVGHNRGDLEVDVALASMATFLFGVLIAFTIARTTERLAVVQNLLSRGNSSMLSIYQLMAIFPEPDAVRVRVLIDRQLTSQIDYRLVDNHLSTPPHLALNDAVFNLDPQTRQEEIAYRSLLHTCIDMTANRALIEATTGQSLSTIEWLGLLLLLLILISLIVVLPGGTVLGALIAGALAGTLVTLVVLLRKLDLLRWHERSAIWEPTTRLFRSMGLHPYVPRGSHGQRPLPAHRTGPSRGRPRSVPRPVGEGRLTGGFRYGQPGWWRHACGGRSRPRRLNGERCPGDEDGYADYSSRRRS